MERIHIPLGVWLKLSAKGRKALSAQRAIVDIDDLSTTMDAQQRALLCAYQLDVDEEREWHDGIGLQQEQAKENSL